MLWVQTTISLHDQGCEVACSGFEGLVADFVDVCSVKPSYCGCVVSEGQEAGMVRGAVQYFDPDGYH